MTDSKQTTLSDTQTSHVNFVIGNANTGKTTIVKDLMRKSGLNMWTVVSEYLPNWETEDNFSTICKFKDLNSYVNNLIHYQKRTDYKNKRGVVLCDAMKLKYTNPVLRNLIINARHHNITVIISSQSITCIDPAFLSQASKFYVTTYEPTTFRPDLSKYIPTIDEADFGSIKKYLEYDSTSSTIFHR